MQRVLPAVVASSSKISADATANSQVSTAKCMVLLLRAVSGKFSVVRGCGVGVDASALEQGQPEMS